MTALSPIARVVDRVAAAGEVPVAQLTGERRHAALVRLRHAAAWVAREAHGSSLRAIGARLGGRDHGTIHYSLARAAALRAADADFRAFTDRLLAEERG